MPAGRPRTLHPIEVEPEAVRELRRAHAEIAALRHRLETVERVLHAVSVLVRPYDADRKRSNGPRPYSRTSDSGQPIYDD
jgi:hypothetical protein